MIVQSPKLAQKCFKMAYFNVFFIVSGYLSNYVLFYELFVLELYHNIKFKNKIWKKTSTLSILGLKLAQVCLKRHILKDFSLYRQIFSHHLFFSDIFVLKLYQATSFMKKCWKKFHVLPILGPKLTRKML